MKQVLYFAVIIIVTLSGCRRGDKGEDKEHTGTTIPAQKEVQAQTKCDSIYSKEYMVLGTLYQQQAAECRALCYQAYNIGKILIDVDLKDKSVDKHRIVVLDIDETVLDNSPYEAECIIGNFNYPDRWDEWCLKASAKAIPGSLNFLNYARDCGISVFYITNRKEHLKDATIANLKNLGFPQADEDHVIMRTSENSKEARRVFLSDKYHISLLFGDNLEDFSDVFEAKSNSGRATATDNLQKEFGKRFIVLPNSMYGEWETTIYKSDKKMPDSLKFMNRRKALQGF